MHDIGRNVTGRPRVVVDAPEASRFAQWKDIVRMRAKGKNGKVVRRGVPHGHEIIRCSVR